MISSCYMIISTLFYSLQYLDVKLISNYYGVWTIYFFRGLVGFILTSLLNYKQRPFLGNNKKLLSIRGVVGSCSILLGFLGIRYINLSLATILLSSTPLWIACITFFYKKTIWHYRNTISCLLCSGGIILLSVYHYKNNSRNIAIGLGASLSSAIFNAIVDIIIVELKNENVYTISVYPLFFSILVSLPGLVIEQNNQPLVLNKFLLELLTVGICSFLAIIFKTLSIQISEHLGVVILRYFDILFSILFDTFILGTVFYPCEMIAMGLITLGLLVSKY